MKPTYRNILLPTDFSEPSAVAARRARAIAKAQGAALNVLHVVGYLPPRYAVSQLPEEFASPERLVAAARVHLSDWVREQGLEVVNEWVEVGSAKSEIGRTARKEEVDLVVMGTAGVGGVRALLGSTAMAVVHDAPCEVLVVRPQQT